MQKYSTPVTNIDSSLSDEQRAINAFNISIGTAILLGLLLVITIVVNGSFTTDPVALITLAAGAIVFGVSAWLSKHNRNTLGTILNIVTLTLIVVSRVFIQKGLSIQIGIVYIVLISSIAVYTLPSNWVGRSVIFAFITAVFTIIADLYTTGIPQSPSSQYVTGISATVGVLYMFVIAIQFPNFPLRTKLIIGFLLLTIVPLLILGWQTYSITTDIVEEQIKDDILRSSLATSTEVQDFLDSHISIVRNQARASEIIEYMSMPESQREGSAKEALVYDKLETFAKTKPSYIRSYTLLDNNGVDILDTDSSRIGTSFAEHEFFTVVISKKTSYVSGLITLPSGGHNVYFASPVTSSSGELSGVYVVTYNSNVIQTIIDAMLRANAAAAATTEYTYLIDGNSYFILAHTNRVDLLYKTYLDINDPRLVKVQERDGIGQDRLSALVIPQPEIVAALSNMEATNGFQAPSHSGELTESVAVRLANANWIVVASQPVSTISDIIQTQTRANVIVGVIITVIAALIALFASNFFTNPIIQLTRVAENISAGDLTQKANIGGNDEIGVLGRTFNNMTDQIQELVGNLEQRVEQRTAQLEETSNQNQKRAQDLQTIAEIARYISTEKDIESLLPLVTRTVSERFGFYHVGIFLLNENKSFAILRAANSTGGQAMLRRQHKLEVGFTGIVGNVTSTGSPRIALDTGADATYFNNPDLPGTRSEMALPLIARGTIIGALDVQSTIPNAFTEADVSIISLLADQVAIAIDNVRLLEDAQKALAESESVFSQYLSEAWHKKSESGVIGYYQTNAGGTVITANNHTNQTNTPSKNEDGTLAIPILVREQVIGTINIRPSNGDKTWNTDDVSIAQAITERLGLALDNARLFEETSTRASRERLVADITTRIRGTNDPQEMIKTAVEELQRALGATRVEIVPQKNSPSPDR
ncbi:MAG: GAF domain-containing protein [Anaerolineales bacterium]|nr:GAF domain-containing protein [Anaerolineales bacterium]